MLCKIFGPIEDLRAAPNGTWKFLSSFVKFHQVFLPVRLESEGSKVLPLLATVHTKHDCFGSMKVFVQRHYRGSHTFGFALCLSHVRNLSWVREGTSVGSS